MEIDPNLRARHRHGHAGLALLAFAFALAGAASACGEDVDFSSGRTQDAGAPDESDASMVSDAAPETAVADGNGRDVGARDGACFASDDAAPLVCRPNGALCRSTNDCCSRRCEDGYCLKLGTCAAPGAPCGTRSSCCSGRCEPTGRNGALECGQYCLADGARCAAAADCCGLACNGGTCGGALCSVVGGACAHDSECCSGRCDGNRCDVVFTSCLPTGEGCGADAGTAGSMTMGGPPDPNGPTLRCCGSGFCDAKTARCDLGPGSCRESSAPCNVDSDCCRGSCTRDADGVDVCTAPCLADGQDCNSNGDCCDGFCGGAQSQCGIAPPVCP